MAEAIRLTDRFPVLATAQGESTVLKVTLNTGESFYVLYERHDANTLRYSDGYSEDIQLISGAHIENLELGQYVDLLPKPQPRIELVLPSIDPGETETEAFNPYGNSLGKYDGNPEGWD